jgi:hypothetical protein
MEPKEVDEKHLLGLAQLSSMVCGDFMAGRCPAWMKGVLESILREFGFVRGAKLLKRFSWDGNDYRAYGYIYFHSTQENWLTQEKPSDPELQQQLLTFHKNSMPTEIAEQLDFSNIESFFSGLGKLLESEGQSGLTFSVEAFQELNAGIQDAKKDLASHQEVINNKAAVYLCMAINYDRIEKMDSLSDVYRLLEGQNLSRFISMEVFRVYCNRIGLSFRNRAN